MNSTSTPPGRPRWLARKAARWAVLLGVTYLLIVMGFKLLENRLVYHPSSGAEWAESPVDDVRDVWLTSADGTRLHAWWLPPQDPDAGAVLFSHGNGGNLSFRGLTAANIRGYTGAGVLLYDYPGYGKSDGSPSEAGCYAAAEAAYAWLTGEAGVPANRVVLLGESLGGGPAVELATRRDHRALVLLYTFTSLPAAAKFHYPWLPTFTLMRNRFDNISKLRNCSRPVLIAHGPLDAVVPYRHAEELYQGANAPKELLRLEGEGHGLSGGGEFYEGMSAFLEKHAPLPKSEE